MDRSWWVGWEGWEFSISLEYHEHFIITNDENIVCSFYSFLWKSTWKAISPCFCGGLCFYCPLGSSDLDPSCCVCWVPSLTVETQVKSWQCSPVCGQGVRHSEFSQPRANSLHFLKFCLLVKERLVSALVTRCRASRLHCEPSQIPVINYLGKEKRTKSSVLKSDFLPGVFRVTY